MTTDHPYTPAELSAATASIGHRWLDMSDRSRQAIAAEVLDAVVLMIERRAQAPLLSLIEDLTDDGPCHYDHNGYCQGHSLDPRPCPHERAKRVLARAHATAEGDHHAA